MKVTRLRSRRGSEKDSKFLRIAISLLATLGIIDTGTITLNRWGLLGSLACPGGSVGCDKVLNSPWGTLLETKNLIIPLSFIGLISYIAILIMGAIPLLNIIKDKKNNITSLTWSGLIIMSFSMSIFSIILIFIMIYKIKAFCFFCVLSAILSILILSLSFRGGSWDNYGQLFFRGTLLSLAILLSSLIWSSNVDSSLQLTNNSPPGTPPEVIATSDPITIKLAEHLKNSDIVMYSAYWCPHCHDQKELFGKEAANKLKIIECAKDGLNNNSNLCKEKGIDSYPSWEINGKIEPGVLSLKELAIKSNFK